jgi:hypothetical protein
VCGEMVDPRGIRMHQNSDLCQRMAKKKARRPQERQDKRSSCQHEFRLLNARELQAVEPMGYTKVCTLCDELE